mgnify:CR=1 FL=1
MRSIQVETKTGSITITDPHQLKSTVDTAFQKRASGGYGPSTWYAGHPLDSATAEGKALRISIAEQGITGTDLRGIPEHIRYLLEDGQYKYVPKLGTRAHPALYLDRGCMTLRTTTQWREYWAARSKGTAPGQSQLSVNLVWSLQLRVDQRPHTHGPRKSAQTKQATQDMHHTTHFRPAQDPLQPCARYSLSTHKHAPECHVLAGQGRWITFPSQQTPYWTGRADGTCNVRSAVPHP